MTEDQASVESLTTETIIADDPHAVLVEFSSMVADTQEYIIKVSPKGAGGTVAYEMDPEQKILRLA